MMTGERVSAPSCGLAKRGSNRDIAAPLIGGTLLAYACAGYGVYALFSAIL